MTASTEPRRRWTSALFVVLQLLLVRAIPLADAYALAFLTPLGVQIAVARPVILGPAGAAANETQRVEVPYGVAIAAAAIVATIPPNFSW